MKVLCLVVVLVAIACVRASKPVGTCPNPDPMDRTEHLPDSEDCTKFWRCDHATPKKESCPSGLHFNPDLQVCDWPYRAGCKAGGSKESGGSSGGSSGGDSEDSDSSSSSESKESSSSPKPPPTTTTMKPTTITKKPTTTTKKPTTAASKECDSSSSSSESGDCGDSADSSGESGEGDVCKGATAHRWHLPHPTDKTKFYKCELSTGKAHLFQCPDNLVFNPPIQVCDWP